MPGCCATRWPLERSGRCKIAKRDWRGLSKGRAKEAPPKHPPHQAEYPTILRLLKAPGVTHTAGMSDPVAPTVLILLYSVVGFLVVLMGMVLGISRRLWRIERWLAEGGGREEAAPSTPSSAETSSGGAFDTFLNEDPSRRQLSKGEQFAAYRRWRHEKGLNWSNS